MNTGFFLFLFLFLTLSLSAKPHGCHLVSGTLSLNDTDPNILFVQTGTQKTILEWNGFSIDAHELVRFQQPGSNSTVLNRVIGPENSAILGQLLSNGQIYLINPNGVLIGPNARIETSSFLASTLDILEADFLNDNFHFSGSSKAPLIHLGKISCPTGNVTLLAQKITNDGHINAPNGHATLATGYDILIQPEENDPNIFIQIHNPDSEIQSEEGIALDHTGTIHALIVDLQSGINPYAKAISSSGTIRATTISEQDGRIFLVAPQGTTEVSGSIAAPAGTVHILGEEVSVLDGTTIDVSGQNGGGTILVGGDYKGQNAEVMNAKKTFVGKDVLLKADALERGDGGKVICWGDEATSHFGKISVRGGEKGGDGGFAEVSAKYLNYRGLTDGRAPCGKHGELLLDPVDIVIGGAATTGSFSACPSSYTVNTGTATNQILNTNLNAQLQLCSVTIDTGNAGSGGSGPNSGSITVSSAIGAGSAWTEATTLTLIANRNIDIGAAITNQATNTGFTAMNFTANGVPTGVAYHGIRIGAAVTSSGGDIRMNGLGGTVVSSRGIWTQGADIISNNGNIYLTGEARTSSNAGIYLDTGGVQSTGTGNITLHGISLGDYGIQLDLTNNGTTSVSGTISLTGTSSNSIGVALTRLNSIKSSSGDIILSGTTNTAGSQSGVLITLPQTTGTSGAVIFSNCQGGFGSNSHAVSIENTFATSGDIIATNSIVGGSGAGSRGWRNTAQVTASGNIAITASTSASNSVASILLGADLTANGGAITLNSDVELSSARTLTALNNIAINATVSGAGLTAASSQGSVIVQNINSSNGNITLQPSTSVQANSFGISPVGTIQLNGTSINAGTGSISLGANSRTTFPSVATIFGNSVTNNNLVFTSGSFTMGSQESMTSFGNVTINATTAIVSDIVAFGSLTISAPSITLTPRQSVQLLAFDGTFYQSSRAHLLSNLNLVFSSALSPTSAYAGILGPVTEEMLIFNPVLNFDPAFFVPQRVNTFSVANAQLSYMLPLLGRVWQWPYRPTFCQEDDEACRRGEYFQFLPFLQENRLKQ